MATAKARGGRGREFAIIAVIVVVLAVAVGVGGYYQDEVGTWFRVQAWNLGPYEQATRDFVAKAAAGDANGLTPYRGKSGSEFQELTEGGRLTGYKIMVQRDTKNFTLKELCPTASPRIGSPRVVPQAGQVSVPVWFPDKFIDFRWTRTLSGPKLTDLRWGPPNVRM